MKGKIEKLGKVSITVEKDYWDKNKAYNRLTIVERQGTSTAYLSRKAVPIGINITDRNYWITISKWADIPYEIVQEFGDSPELVISQKVVTLKVNELQGLIDDINDIIGEGGSIDERIAEEGAKHYTKNETYSKTELNNLITTPDQQYVSVASYQDLPDTGSADTIYRVGGTTSYSEYAWNGTTFVQLSEKNVGIDDVPTYESNNLVKSGGVHNSIKELEVAVFGGTIILTPISTHDGFVNNGNVAGTDKGYWVVASGWQSKIYDVTEIAEQIIAVEGAKRTQSYSYIFCKDYSILPENEEDYNSNPDNWLNNKISVLSARGAIGNIAYSNPSLNVPAVPNGATHVYLIIAEYTNLPASATHNSTGALPSKQDLLIFDNTPQENSDNPVKSNGVFRAINPLNINMYGINALVEKKIGTCLFYNSSTYQGAYSNNSDYGTFNCYIFNVTSLVGGDINTIALKYSKRVNTSQYYFVDDYTAITYEYTDISSHIILRGSGIGTNIDPSEPNIFSVDVPLTDSAIMSQAAIGQIYLIVNLRSDYEQESIMLTPGVLTRLDRLENNVLVNTSIKSLNPIKDFMPKIKQMVHQFYSPSSEPKWKTTPLLLVHFSDVHANGVAMERMIDWCSEFNDIADIVHTGDAVSGTLDDGMAFWSDIEGAKNILNVIGNHDASQGSASQVDVYNTIIAPFVEYWNVVQPENAAVNGLCYWYKDYPSNKVRLIGLNCMNKTSAQLDWLDNVLSSAKVLGYTVVIAYHSSPSSNYQRVDCCFNDPYPFMSFTAYAWVELENKISDFIADGGLFACYLCGHSHKDYVLFTNSGQLVIGVDGMTTGIADRTHTISVDDKSQDLFNLVAIDTYRKTIKLLRVGCDTDDQLRHIGQCSIKYDSGIVISNL